jgi:hypothetical protein
MAYPNMDLQSLPDGIDLRVGTDQAERALQLSYWQIWAAIQTLHDIDTRNLYPEKVVNAGDESTFDTNITNLVTDLVASMVHFDAIWALVP